ncbi:MAG: protoporphyrinogen oxidase [Thermodesulfobacteriota bacterium]|nr:MAG: protoporphyrinogen oxidase [Thermodesulfobacteriota bacterium]
MIKKIVVIGGGIAGLSTAHRLIELQKEKNLDIEVLLIEKTNKLGGPITTIKKGDFLIELGPDMFFTKKPWALELSKRLGLENELIETNESKRGTYVLWQKKLVPVPEGFLMLAPSKVIPFLKTPLFSWAGKLRMMLDFFISKKCPTDESLASFVRRRFGNEALERVAQPMIGGIYTADPEKLSLKATMPQFIEMEQKYGSVIKGMLQNKNDNKKDSGARYSQFLSFKNGMGTLIDALERSLEECISLNEAVTQISRNEERWEIQTERRNIEASGVIVTIPSYHTASLVQNFDTELSSELTSIEYASSSVVIFAYKTKEISHELSGFGFVVPDVEKSDLIACSFSSIKFDGRAPEDHILIRAFLGGALNPEVLNLDDNQIIDRAKNELEKILGIQGNPELTLIQRYPDAMPQYHLGHLDKVANIQNRLSDYKGLEIAGNAYSGVGIPECVYSGEQAAENIIKTLF